MDELIEICADLKDEINVSRLSIIEKSTLLFELLDTDKNGLIDALEFMSTIAAISGMRLLETIEFILTSYDFDSTGELSVDEVTLALKSVTTGLCKLCIVKMPREETIEQLVSTMFSEMVGNEASDMMRVRINVIVEKLLAHPDVRCWYSYFGNTPQVDLQLYDLTIVDKDFDRENQVVMRNKDEMEGYDWNIRCVAEPGDQVGNQADALWIASVSMLVPLAFSNQTMSKHAPDASMTPVWVYGYQAEQARNNLRYNFQGDIVYNTGKHVVVYNFNNHKQIIFSTHVEEILALSMHPDGQYCATGEAGNLPRVLVWHTVTREVAFMSRGFHKDGIAALSFSNEGKLLSIVGNDPMHRVSVHRWETNETLFTADVDEGQAMSTCFLLDGSVAVGGDSYLHYWASCPEGYLKRRANFTRYAPLQPVTALAQIGSSDSMVAGTASGQLFLFSDRNCVRNIKAHEGTINALYSCAHGLLSGGRDKRVRLWTAKLEPGATFDMSSFGFNPSIRSACLSADGACILVGTKGSNIYEVSSIDGSDVRGGPVVSGHSWGKLNSVATHPSKHEFATVGDDKRIRIWDMKTKSLLKIASFDADVMSVAYSPVGDQLALGLGGDPSLKKCGAYVVLNEEDMVVMHEARDSSTAICLTKYSPEGETLAVGAEDGAIYLYAVLDEFELIGKCVRHTMPVTELDFSADGEWIRTNSKENDLQFFNSDDASLQSNLPAMRDVVWASWTCPFNWHVKAAHRTAFKGEKVSSIHTPSSSPNYLCVGTSYGYLRLHLFPCVPDESESHRFPAHAGPVGSVRFSFDETHLVSAGEHDRTIIQWRCSTFDEDPDVEVLDMPESDDYALEVREGSDLEEDFMAPNASTMDGVMNAQLKSDPKDLQSTPKIDAWFDSVVAPTQPPKQRTAIPDLSLRLEYVHGYRAQGMRNNVRYSKGGEVIFVASTLGVAMARGSKAQKFFQRHTDAISSFACTNDGAFAATGQHGHDPFVVVWDTATCQSVATIPDVHANAVSCMAFSNNSKLLATVGLDEDHTISIYEWRSGSVVTRMYGGSAHIFDIAFSKQDKDLVACGVKYIRFFTDIMNKAPTCSRPTLGSVGSMQSFMCCNYFAGAPVVGTRDGNIYMFVDNALKTTVKAHDGSVSTMDVDSTGTCLVTGGKDGAVRIWNVHLECTKEITVNSVFPDSGNAAVKAACFSPDANNILIGTRGAEILEVSVRSGALVGKPLLQCHGSRELWGLATHPTKPQFVTSGDDMTIRLWDAKSFTVTKTLRVDTASRAICYSPDGKYICIGFGFGKRVKGKGALKEGSFTILTSHDLKMAHEGKDSNEPIRVCKFSPDSTWLAIGSEDSCIYIYNVRDYFSKKAAVNVHKAPVMYLDFTADGQYLMSVDSTKRISFSEVHTGMHIPSPVTLREEKWSTWTSPVGWPVQGLWICQPQDVEPVSMQRSWAGTLMACGNSGGRLQVVHNPCPQRGGFVSSRGHAGSISQVGWLAGDGTIITIGNRDSCVFQWSVVFDEVMESGEEGGVDCEDSEVDRDAGHEFPDKAIVRSSDNYGKVPLWHSAITPPSDIQDEDPAPPKMAPKVDFVHGFRSGDVRSNIHYNADGHVVYSASTYGIVFDRDSQQQFIYEGHDSAVISIAVDMEGKVAASGELAESPQLHLWDARTAQCIKTFVGLHRRGISSLSFSESGEYLVSLGQDVMSSIVVLRSPSRHWHDAMVICSTSVSPRKMLFVRYVESNTYPIVVGGSKTIYFFRKLGTTLERVKGTFGKQKKIQPILCGVGGEECGQGESQVYTGTVSGHIYVWEHCKVAFTVTAHDSPIYALSTLPHGYASAGKDGIVKLWSPKLQLVHTYNTQAFKPAPYATACHSLCTNIAGTRITIGMRSGEIYEISLPTHARSLLIEGHSYRELHAVCANPQNGDEYATCGDDGILRVWSYNLRRCQRRVDVEAASRALCFSPNGERIVVGLGGDPTQATKDGAFMILKSDTLEIVLEDRKAKLYITQIKYTPDGNIVAMASADSKVYLHAADNYAYLRTVELPVSPNTRADSMDFSLSGHLLRVSTNQEELFFFKTESGDVITAPLDVRDEKWSSNSCPYTWDSQGKLPSFLSSASTSFFGQLLWAYKC